MNRLENFAQTYSQAPWRKQMQYIVVFSIVVVFVSFVAGLYVDISARTAAAGRRIQSMQYSIEKFDQDIEHLTSEIAELTSDKEMQERAREMGYREIQIEEITYITVTGYTNRHPVILAPYSGRELPRAKITPLEYTESIFAWLKRQFTHLSSFFVELTP